MLILKHLKTLQHVSIIIQIILRELVGHAHTHTHTKRYAAASQLTFHIFKFLNSVTNKGPTSSLKMI